jgi:hypothetical protein
MIRVLALVGFSLLLPRVAHAQEQDRSSLTPVALPPVSALAQGGYFTEGDKHLTYKQAGSRSRNEMIVLLSIFGTAAVAGAVGTYFALDSQSKSVEVSASGVHTGRAWSADLDETRKDALRSRTVAQVSFGVTGALMLGGAIAFIITSPDDELFYQNWQTRSFIAPIDSGLVAGSGWSF